MPHQLSNGLADQGAEAQLRTGSCGSWPRVIQQTQKLFTDGSGGPAWANANLRKAGAGAATVLTEGTFEQRNVVINDAVLALGPTSLGGSRCPGPSFGHILFGVRPMTPQPLPGSGGVEVSYVVGDTRKQQREFRTGDIGDMWSMSCTSYPPAAPQASNTASHRYLHHVVQDNISFEHYLYNSLVGVVATILPAWVAHP